MTFEAKYFDIFLSCTKCLWKNGPYMDTNPAFKSFLNELCANEGPLQKIIICWSVLPTLILLPLFVWGFSEKIFRYPYLIQKESK